MFELRAGLLTPSSTPFCIVVIHVGPISHKSVCFVVVTQIPGLGSQTSLSLQECLRLLEATFPFGEESEVESETDTLHTHCMCDLFLLVCKNTTELFVVTVAFIMFSNSLQPRL